MPWEDALDLVAERLSAVPGRGGARSPRPKLTNEELYLMQKVVRGGLGTNNIDSPPATPKTEALAVLEQAFGFPAMTNNLLDTRQTAGCILLVGDSIYETHPVYAYQLQRLIRLRDMKLIVISPHPIKMMEWATLTLGPRPGSEELLLAGIARDHRGREPGDRTRRTSPGLAAWQAGLGGLTPKQVASRPASRLDDMRRRPTSTRPAARGQAGKTAHPTRPPRSTRPRPSSSRRAGPMC